MTKQQEIALIDQIIRDHEHDSYLAPFLKLHRAAIVELIKCDLPLTHLNTVAGSESSLRSQLSHVGRIRHGQRDNKTDGPKVKKP